MPNQLVTKKDCNGLKVVLRPCFKLRFSTWEFFKNPCLSKEDLMAQVFKSDTGDSFQLRDINSTALSKIVKQLQNKIKNKNWKKLVNFHCPVQGNGHKRSFGMIVVNKRDLVSLFRAIGNDILPNTLFGKKNKLLNQFVKNMCILLTAPGKNSPILLDQLCHRLNPAMILWTKDVSNDTQIQEWVLAKVVSWLATNIFWRTITGFFGIMETSYGKNDICFVRKMHIQSALVKEINRLSSLHRIKFIESKQKIKKILDLPNAPAIARCRFLLKKNGTTRLICMKRKVMDEMKNNDIRNKVTLLSFSAQKIPGLIDVKGVQFYSLWRNFVTQVKQGIHSKIYIIVTDIQDAYGSVDHSKLVSIVNKLRNDLPEHIYIHNVKYTYPNSSTRRIFHRRIPSYDKHFQFKFPAQTRPYEDKVNSVIELNVNEMIQSVCQRIRLHTLSFTIGRKKNSYLLNHGLVQGDSLSVPLCNLYYGNMTYRHLKEFLTNDITEHNNGGHQRLLARGMDDFIFATTEMSEAERFLERMNRGFPDYGCQIQSDKTSTNLEPCDVKRGKNRFKNSHKKIINCSISLIL